MSFSAKPRMLILLHLLLLLPVAWAGAPNYRWFPKDNNLTTNGDDRIVARVPKWHGNSELSFFLARTGGEVLLPSLNSPVLGGIGLTAGEVNGAVTRAIAAWNDAQFKGTQFNPEVLYSDQLPPLNGMPRGSVLDVAIDGVNLITFLDETTVADNETIGITRIIYFARDFDISDIQIIGAAQLGLPLDALQFAANGDYTEVTADLDGDGNIEFAIPIANYSQGDVIDIDIAMNSTFTPSYRVWPEDRNDVPGGSEVNLPGSLDIQGLLMSKLGYARGLANSFINDAVMNQYWNPNDGSNIYPTDPYSKRTLKFDDLMTLAQVEKAGFGASRGTIRGSVLDGSVVDGVPLATDSGLEYMMQAPVYIGVRPEVLANSQALAAGQADQVAPQNPHPDNIESDPLTPDANAGTYRLVAQVLSGEDLEVTAGAGEGLDEVIDQLVGTDEEEPTAVPPGNPDFEADATLITFNGQFNSIFNFPGLPPTDDSGAPIDYAVYLGPDSTEHVNPIDDWFSTFIGRADYPEEFFGGPLAALNLGTGSAGDANISGDNFFENQFVTVEYDRAGRFSAAINSGPGLLSGFGVGSPHSYIVLTTPQGSYSNKFGNLGTPTSAVIINDVSNSASGTWTRAGEFSVTSQLKITDEEGANGLPTAFEVSHIVTNQGATASSFSLRQVLDAYLFGTENPLYVKDDGTFIENSTVLTAGEIPDQLIFQSSRTNPAFRTFVSLRVTGSQSPDRVAIGPLADLGKATASGTAITGSAAGSLDTGIGINYDGFQLQPGESIILRFVVGFLPVGSLRDTWAPPGAGVATADQDDPEKVDPVRVTAGQVTDGINIITNIGESTGLAGGQSVTDGYAAGPLRFLLGGTAIPDKDYSSTGGKLADVDNDGDLDLVVCAFGGGTDPVGGSINRLLLNQQRINRNGTVSYFFQDVTFGSDSVPGTADDRMPAIGEQTIDVATADFDGDGDIDLFFTNQGAPNRLYINDGLPDDPARLGYFSNTEGVIPGAFNGLSIDNAWRCTAGDIDSDGDFDLIISQQLPLDEGLSYSLGWVDASPREQAWDTGDRLFDMEEDLFTAQAMYVAERVLINMVNTPNYSTATRGFYFVDDTLGADGRFGTLSNAVAEIVEGTTNTLFITEIDPADFDRMPPVFPGMFNTNALDSDPWEIDTVVTSNMGLAASEPRLGPFASDSNLDLFSMRSFQIGPLSPSGSRIPLTVKEEEIPVIVGSGIASGSQTYDHDNEPGIFRNVDLFNLSGTGSALFPFVGADGVADGYFACINYNMDYGIFGDAPEADLAASGTGPGLFRIDVLTVGSVSNWVRDAWPLFIGMPDGHPGDYTPSSGFEGDAVVSTGIGGWAGVIADLTNEGAPKAILAGDNDGGGGFLTSYVQGQRSANLLGPGASRGISTLISGLANNFWPMDSLELPVGPYSVGLTQEQPNEWLPTTLSDAQPGEPYGLVAGDFDHDGDQDLIQVYSTVPGIRGADGTFFLSGQPVPHQALLNDSLGFMAEQLNTFVPNPDVVTFNVCKGDIDNDGDLDLVMFNALTADQVYFNDIYQPNAPPDLSLNSDPTLFYQTGADVVPPAFSVADSAPFPADGVLSGVDVRSEIGDWNMDGRPDVATAEGGLFSQTGGAAKLLFNRGQNFADAVPVYQPAGADFPAPRLVPAGAYNSVITTGLITDIVNGDFSGDGAPDMIIVRTAPTGEGTAGGLQLRINIDSDDPSLNSVPDPDLVADGIFVNGTLPAITTPGVDLNGLNLKLQGRKASAADVDADGDLDLVVANSRQSGGAPNVLLLNLGGATFVDATETNLPLSGATGLLDNTQDLAVADFDGDGFVDIIFANESNASTPVGFRYLKNNGDGTFAEMPFDTMVPSFLNTKPRGIAIADFDKLGEWTEDKNFNGFLDPGEDLNFNGIIDFEDLPDESSSGDLNGDGIVTTRRAGLWDGSLDVYVSMDNGISRLLINDPSNAAPGTLSDQTSLRIPEGLTALPSRGVSAGDINLDGLTDIVVSQFIGGLVRPVRVYLNENKQVVGGRRAGYFKEVTYEVPFARAMLLANEVGITGEEPLANTPWAYDVDLVDYDLDGDLDMYITTLGNALSPVTIGAADLFYINRAVGDNFNFKPRDLARTPGSPLVYFASPSGALRSQLLDVVLTGENLDASTEVAFGEGINVVSKTLVDSRRVRVQIQVLPDASLGPRRVTVSSSAGGYASSSKLGLFYVFEALDQPIHNAVPDRIWTLLE